jgi:hypothetical protein
MKRKCEFGKILKAEFLRLISRLLTLKHVANQGHPRKAYQPKVLSHLRCAISPIPMQAMKNWASYFTQLMGSTPVEPSVSVSQLWVYPLKSARGIRVESSKLGPFGFEYDRIYMLVEEKPLKDNPSQTQWQVMTLRTWPKVCLPKLTKSNNDPKDGPTADCIRP